MVTLTILPNANNGTSSVTVTSPRRKGRLFHALRRSTKLGPSMQDKLRKRKSTPFNEIEAKRRPLRLLMGKIASPATSPLPSPSPPASHSNKKNKENRKPTMTSVSARRRQTSTSLSTSQVKPRNALSFPQPLTNAKLVLQQKTEPKVPLTVESRVPTAPSTSSVPIATAELLLTPGFSIVGRADPLRGSRAVDEPMDEATVRKRHEKREREEKSQLRRDRIWHNEVGWRRIAAQVPATPVEPPIQLITFHHRVAKKLV